MRVTQISYGFTKNLGNYQSARADVTIDLPGDIFETDPGVYDKMDDAFFLASCIVKDQLGEGLSLTEVRRLNLYQKEGK